MRLRSFLYLTLAATVATALDAKEIWMSENGIMTPGIPFSPSRIGPYSTRTTHPIFVDEFSRWYSGLAKYQVNVHNPFEYSTKSEIIRKINNRGFASDLRKTVSCFRRQFAMRKGASHCGYCVPCLVRRVSFIFPNLEADDTPDGYIADFLDFDKVPQNGKSDLVDLASFSMDFDQLSPGNLGLKYVDLYGLRDTDRIKKTIETLRRFGHEFLDVLQTHGKPNLKSALGIQ